MDIQFDYFNVVGFSLTHSINALVFARAGKMNSEI